MNESGLGQDSVCIGDQISGIIGEQRVSDDL